METDDGTFAHLTASDVVAELSIRVDGDEVDHEQVEVRGDRVGRPLPAGEAGVGRTVVDPISVARKVVPGAVAGEAAGPLLKGIARQQVERGTQVRSA